MAFDFNALLYDPRFSFGAGMLAANARSPDPRSSSLGWALSQGMGMAQDTQKQQSDMENRRAYAEMQQAYLLRGQQEAEEKRRREAARAQSLAGMFTPPTTGGDPRGTAMQRIQELAQVDPDAAMKMLEALDKGILPGVPKQPDPVKPAQPPGYFSLLSPEEQLQAARTLGGLQPRPTAPAQPPGYFGNLSPEEQNQAARVLGGVAPRAQAPKTPTPPAASLPPGYFSLLSPEEQAQAARVLGGVAPRAQPEKPPAAVATPTGPQPPGYFQHLSPEEQAQAARVLGGIAPRATPPKPAAAKPAAKPAGSSKPTASGGKPLNRTEWNKRISISRARASISKLGVDRATAERMAKTDAGFKSTLDLANQKMPGDDPAWEATMKRRVDTAKKPAAAAGAKAPAKSKQQLQADLDATKDPALRKLKIESAKRRGIILQDKVQTGGFRQRLGF